MLKRRVWLLFLLALVLRLLLQAWDAGSSTTTLHPDERQVGFVTEALAGWFADPGFYAYGSLHFHAVRGVAAVLDLGGSLRGLVVSGRLLSLAASMIALALGWLLAERAWGRRTATLYLVLVAWVPLDLQQSHFATVEAHHAAWVMATLAACYWLARGGGIPAAAAAGAAFGASLAVKVSSLAVVLPLLAALAIAGGRRPQRLAGLGAAAGAAAAAAFWLAQPSAFAASWPPLAVAAALALAAAALGGERGGTIMARPLAVAAAAAAAATAVVLLALAASGGAGVPGLTDSYLRGVGEQVSMVLGRSDLPYVRVYAPTLPVLYPLRELALWGWGAALLTATVAGSLVGLRLLLRRRRRWLEGRLQPASTLLILVLLWLLPMAGRLATLEVKYLRYWQPLVVPAALIAAWWIVRLPARTRRRVAPLVVSGTVLWGLAYLWAFVEPHPHRTATEWLEPMLEDGQTVAFESWDESLPLDPADGPVERLTLPSYDLPDDEAKAERWAAELARADWVVLTSNRVVKTVLANPRRFALTGRLYRLLLSGEAGFEPLARVARGPRILGLRWPVQLADESFVNYDFPQVVILRRVTPMAARDLLERVRRPVPFLESVGHRELQRRYLDRLPAVPAVPTAPRQLLDLAVWAVVFGGLCLAAWALLLPLLRRLPDAGLGLAAASGWIFLSWLMWLGSELALWSTGPATASWLFLVLVSGGLAAAVARRTEVSALLRSRRGAMLRVAVVALGAGLLFLVVRAGNPAIYWGEKPMDFAFLNAFLGAESWPPGEPWMAGMPLHYYYFGQVLAAVPILVGGVTPGVGYNLVAATIPALAAAVLAGLGLALARRRRWFAAAVLPLLVLLSGNLAWPWLLELARGRKWFDLWWATSRVVPGFAIDEYPLWTALFADLHGHFVALPVLLATLAWGWILVREDGRGWPAAAAACGIGAAALAATNPWDLFILSSALGLGCVAAARHPLAGLGRLAVAAAVSVVAAAPFIVEMVTGIAAGAGGRGLFLTRADFAPAWAVLRHFGLFLIPLAAAAMARLGRRSWLVLPTAGLGVLGGLAFSSSAAALALAAAAIFATALVHARARLDRLGWAMALLGALAVAACERFTLIDRMNTIFKVYNGAWIVLAVALATLLLRTRGPHRRLLLGVWLPLQLVALVNLPLGIAQGWLQPRIGSPTPSLDGQAFLERGDPQTWFLVRALVGAARPGDVVAESAGPYYSQHTRIAMHTGQPTVVGWEWHLTQRGQPVEEIGARMADLETLYSDRRPGVRREILDRYRVRWVVLADLERQRYRLGDGDVFRGVPGLVEVGRHADAVLYRVLPNAAAAPAPMPAFELPPGADVIAALPQPPSESPARSLALDAAGGLVLLRDGRVLELDLDGRRRGELEGPGCTVVSVALTAGAPWAACADGRLYRRDGDRWTAAGRVPEGHRLTGGEKLRVWGESGLRELDGPGWKTLAPGPVTAAAAREGWLAFSDGAAVEVEGPAGERRVAGRLEGVRDLAWLGADLVALTDAGLLKSGGALLPWRRVTPDMNPLSLIAGHGGLLWLVRDDGLLIAQTAGSCPSPWEAGSGAAGSRLREPRDLAASAAGWFAVADTLNHRVLWYDLEGACIDRFGSEGAGIGQFREPSGLAVAADGSLAVADTWNGRLQVLRPDGRVEVVGSALYGPREVMWDDDGDLWVADTGNRRILRFVAPDWRELPVAQLEGPVVGLARLPGRIAAAVPQAGVVVLLDPASGAVVERLQVPGWSALEQQEGYLAALPSGELVASAPRPGELWVLDPAGAAPPRLLRGGLPGVTGLTVLPDGDLLAALTWEHRLVRVSIGP